MSKNCETINISLHKSINDAFQKITADRAISKSRLISKLISAWMVEQGVSVPSIKRVDAPKATAEA